MMTRHSMGEIIRDRARRLPPEPVDPERKEAAERAVLGTPGLFFWILVVFV